MRRLAAILLLVLALQNGARAFALEPGQKALLLLRVLAYDRNLKKRSQKEVRIAVVFRPRDAASERERDLMVRALNEVVGKVMVAGLRVRVTAVACDGMQAFSAAVDELRPAAMFVGVGLDGEVSEVARVARERSALTFSGAREHLGRGVAVALLDRGEKAAVAINLGAALSQGADLDSALLYVAERVD